MIIGDYNEILVSTEKEGGNLRPGQYMQNFRECIEECNLQEVMFVGDPFTWSRGAICERLDRGLCNDAWATKFPFAAVIHEQHVHSDHRPLVLDTNYFEKAMTQKPKGERGFEAYWLQKEIVDEIVKSAWQRAQSAGIGPGLVARTKVVKDDLHQWDREVLKGPKKRIAKLKKRLEKLRCSQLTVQTRKEMKEVQTLIENLLD